MATSFSRDVAIGGGFFLPAVVRMTVEIAPKYQGTIVEITVILQLHQGVPEIGRNRLRLRRDKFSGGFLPYFFPQKSKKETVPELKFEQAYY